MNRTIFFICVFTLLGCRAKADNTSIQDPLVEYTSRYTFAMTSKDSTVIISTIEYMKNLQKTKGDTVRSINLNIAQLLFRIGRTEEALFYVSNEKGPLSLYYKALLLHRLGKFDESTDMLKIFLSEQKQKIKVNNLSRAAKIGIANSIFIVANLLNIEMNEINDFFTQNRLLSSSDIEWIKQQEIPNRDQVIESIWPDPLLP